MKKLKWFVIFISFLLCSCGTQIEKEYKVTIEYCINNAYTVIETYPLYLEEHYTPIYSYDGNNLAIHGVYGYHTSADYKVVYRGNLPIKIINFDYKAVRTYKVSKFDGHEITP